MFDSEYGTEDYNTIGVIMENSEMLKIIPDHLKTKKNV